MVTRLTGGDTPGDPANPRTFPEIYDEAVDELERLAGLVDDLEARVEGLETSHAIVALSRVTDVSAALALTVNQPAVTPFFVGSAEGGALEPPWHDTSVDGGGNGTIAAVEASAEGIPAYHGDWVVKTSIPGTTSTEFARVHYEPATEPDDSLWVENTERWYGAAFYFPSGFFANLQSTHDILRWDAFEDGSGDMKGGLGITADNHPENPKCLRLMRGDPFDEPLVTSYTPPEDTWVWIEVHQVLNDSNGQAFNEIRVDDGSGLTSLGSNTNANAYFSSYVGESDINRLRTGIVSSSSSGQTNPLLLYFDYQTVSDEGFVGGAA